VRLSPVLIGMRPESGAAETLKALKARAHVEMTSATLWRLRSAREQIQFLVLPFELFMVLIPPIVAAFVIASH
jgi:hypothetical protein